MQNKKASIQKNYIYNLLYDIFVLIVPFITTPYIARVLSIESIGLYSYSYSIVMYFTAFVVLGTKSYAIKRVAQAKDPIEASCIFWDTFILRCISGIFTLSVYYLYVLCIADNTSVALIQSIYIIAVVFDISWFFQGLENFKVIVLRNAFFKLISVFFIFLLVNSDRDFFSYLFILSGVNLIGNISLWTYLPSSLAKIRIRDLAPFTGIKEIIVLFVPTLALQVYSATGSTLLGAISKDMSQNGYYEQANKIVSILLTIITSLSIVVLPRISNLFANKECDKIRECMQKSYRFIMFLSFPMILGLFSVSDKFVLWFLGDQYAPAIPLICILSLLFLIKGISNITGFQYLVATDRQGIYSFSIVIGVAFNIIANIILIPPYSAMGVAIATVVSELIVCIIQLAYLIIIKKEFSKKTIFGGIGRYLVGSILMSAVIHLIRQFGWNNLFGLAVDVIVGIIVYLLFVILTKDQMVISFVRALILKSKIVKPAK